MTGITDFSNEIPTPVSGGSGPGRLVRQAREKVKLSIEDLAAQIKLARHTLDAIERDDFAQLNEPVYVRGYYRKLSKVLPVAESELLAAYEQMAGTKAPPHPSKLILAGGAELGSGRRLSPKLAGAIIVAGLLIGGLAFWGKNRSNDPVVTPEPASEPAAAMPDAAPALPETIVSEPVTPQPSAATEPAPAQAASEIAPAPSQPAPPASGPLRLQFNGTSWAEVKDASGKVLISGLVDAGSSQVLDGRPPFVVFLGNAPAVSITYNGQPVDMSTFRRGDNTARITLP